jgi:hypothetical protein
MTVPTRLDFYTPNAGTVFLYSGVKYVPAPGTVDLALVTAEGRPIEYMEAPHIHVWVSEDGFEESAVELKTPDDYSFTREGQTIHLVVPTAAGQTYILRRLTPLDRYVVFNDGALLTARKLNRLTRVNLYRDQERAEQLESGDGVASGSGGGVVRVTGGSGLTGDVTFSGALSVGTGPGIAVGPDSVSLDRSTVDRWYAPISHVDTIDAHTDVVLTGPIEGQVLTFDALTRTWRNRDLPADSGGGGSTITGVMTPGADLSGGSFNGTANVTWNVTGSVTTTNNSLMRRSSTGDAFANVYYGGRFEGNVAKLGKAAGAGTAGVLVGANTDGQSRVHFLDASDNVIGFINARTQAMGGIGYVGYFDTELRAGTNVYTGKAIIEGGRDSVDPVVFRRGLNNQISRIDSGGNYQVGSGLAMKRDVADFPRGLEEVLQMRPVSFGYKFDTDQDPSRIGFIAEELKEIVPEVVQDNEEGLSYAPSLLIPVLVKAIQDLTARLQFVEEVIVK